MNKNSADRIHWEEEEDVQKTADRTHSGMIEKMKWLSADRNHWED